MGKVYQHGLQLSTSHQLSARGYHLAPICAFRNLFSRVQKHKKASVHQSALYCTNILDFREDRGTVWHNQSMKISYLTITWLRLVLEPLWFALDMKILGKAHGCTKL